MKLQDPILQLEQHLRDSGHFSEEKKNEIHTRVMKQILDAAEFAKTEAEPELQELFRDVYKGAG
jgi:TPP-dependent pyruvate/acetoin dehydrogenase alpha subunit